jgi:hypothetical protein
MAQDVYTKWRVRDINDMLAISFDYLRVWGCATVDGSYAEITQAGVDRPALATDTEYYGYTALNTSYLFFKADLYNSTSGETSDMSLPVSIESTGVTNVTDRAVLCAHLTTGDFQAPWQSFEFDDIALTRAAFHQNGQVPWTAGADWSCVFALCYTDETSGIQEGFNLTGSTVTVNVKDRYGNVIDTFVSGTEITLRTQGVARSSDGTMGEFVLTIADTALPDYPANATAYTPGIYDMDVKVLWSDNDISLEGRGKIEIVRSV